MLESMFFGELRMGIYAVCVRMFRAEEKNPISIWIYYQYLIDIYYVSRLFTFLFTYFAHCFCGIRRMEERGV